MFDQQRSLTRQFLQGLPIPMLVIAFGALTVSVIWVVTDYYQSNALSRILNQTMENQLELRARESLVHFENMIHDYSAKASLLAQHRRMHSYLSQQSWLEMEEFQIIQHQGSSPEWIIGQEQWAGLPAPEHIALLDLYGSPREIYSPNGKGIPGSFRELSFSYADPSYSYIAKLDGSPHLVITELLDDSNGQPKGVLLILKSLDSNMLVYSQRKHQLGTTVLALIDGETLQVLASSKLAKQIADSGMDPGSSDYDMTSQSLYDYEGAYANILFATLVPINEVEQMGQDVLDMGRNLRLIDSLVMLIASFLLFVIISRRLNSALGRISKFSRRVLGLQHSPPGYGNQLLAFEDWVREFIVLVEESRHEMQVQHESQMKESEMLKSALLSTSLDSIISIDQQGSIVDFNPTAEQALGHEAHSVIGRRFEDFILAETSREAFQEQLYNSLLSPYDGREVVRHEHTAIKADNKTFPVELAIKPMLLDDRLLFTVYIHDISQRKRQEAEIRTLAAFPSESPSPVLRVNRPGVVIYANMPSEPLLRHWGCGRAQTLPVYWRGLVQSVLDENRMREMEVQTDAAIFSLLMAPIKDLGYVNIYARDITQTRKAENAARQRQNELIHVARLSTMGEMATGIAHELNQPLSAILNYASGCVRRIQQDVGDKNDLIKAIEQIRGQATRAGEIIKRLRSMVSRQQPEREWKNLNNLVIEVCALLQNETGRLGVTVERKLEVDELMVNVDPVLIEQAILNLLRNALDALSTVASSKRYLVITTGVKSNAMAFVSIHDNGPGMSQKVLRHLFDPFFSTKENGMGMGLAITQTIISEHNGKILADSKPNMGAVFTIELPLVEEIEEGKAL